VADAVGLMPVQKLPIKQMPEIMASTAYATHALDTSTTNANKNIPELQMLLFLPAPLMTVSRMLAPEVKAQTI
jgi:hypothetical protein